jgi:CheY-like chemotaxis protein
VSIVVVDDEDAVTQIVSAELQSHGYEVVTSSGPAEGFSAVRSWIESGRKVVLVTDLRMPTTTGRSFFGGFELVSSLKRSGFRVPVLLMTEKLTSKVRARAKKLGIQKAVFKPALSKLDPEQYGADLRSFAAVLMRRLDDIDSIESPGDTSTTTSEQDDKNAQRLDFLTDMTERLLNPSQPGEISRMVLSVTSKYTERGILFLVKGDTARGLAGFGLSNSKQKSSELAQKLILDIDHFDLFAEVVHSKSARRSSNTGALDSTLLAKIDRGQSRECIVIPMINNREVLALLYADNNVTGKPLGKLRGLELFLAQAGMALENLSLHRKLSLFQSKLSPEPTKAEQG